MRNPLRSPVFAIIQNEVLLASKRIAPYALMTLFAANALLWWGQGPAVRLGWATNSDYYIVRNLQGFSFLLGLPIFNAIIMGDPVIRDFRLGIDPLIFSKPINRVQYLLGKFLGSFLVLVCCQAAFPLTLLVLQAFRTSQMIVQPVRVFPYFKHFFFFVVISHLVLAAVYFTVGTLTRNSKIVYGLAACFYPLYISYQVFLLKGLSLRWRILLDPMMLNSGPGGGGFKYSADFLNRYVVSYTGDMIANRLLVILVTVVSLAILYLRFRISERSLGVEKFSMLSLSTATERVYYDHDSFQETRRGQFEKRDSPEQETRRAIPLPAVARASEGIRTNVNKLIAALGVEFRLLLSERSLVVIMPLAVLISTLEVAFWSVSPDPSYSAAYAGNTARSLLLFLLGITIFYTGEAMHRDRDLRIEPLLWSQAGPNYVLLLSKFLATLLLTLALVFLVAVIAIILQGLKHNGPIELTAYARIYFVIVVPNAIFLAAAALMLNVLLRDRNLTYAATIGACAGLFYLYTQGHNHWLYNPLLFQLWNYSDLVGGRNYSQILQHRIYILTLAALFLGLAHLGFPRKSKTTLRVR
jgi:ABC-type transport system involved in multi-copper enzyme maturation permease subunit